MLGADVLVLAKVAGGRADYLFIYLLNFYTPVILGGTFRRVKDVSFSRKLLWKKKKPKLSSAKIALLWQNPLTISHQLSVAKQSLPHGDVQSMIAWCLRFPYTVTKGITSMMVSETTLPITELIRECILSHRTTCSPYILEQGFFCSIT